MALLDATLRSRFSAIAEAQRRASSEDDDFWRAPVYFFELQTTASSVGSLLFPLVLAPEQLSIEEPFAVSEMETVDSGLWLERNGIIRRTIRLRGTTGSDPKRYTGGDFTSLRAVTSSARSLQQVPKLRYSGQRHFQFLQDMFRVYSDLLQNPEFAHETQLIFHNQKDREHWYVEPRRFSSDRSAGQFRVHYPWDIELLAYRRAEARTADFSEDKDLLDRIKDTQRSIDSIAKTARGAIQGATALAQDLENVVSGFATTLNNYIDVIDDLGDFLNGGLISSPLDSVNSVITNLTDTLDTIYRTVTVTVPDSASNNLRIMLDQIERITLFPEIFEDDTNSVLRRARQQSEIATSVSSSRLLKAADGVQPNSFQALLARGTGLLPNDLQKAEGELNLPSELTTYRSAFEIPVSSGDTLQNLAARYLGNARRWRAIAVLNDLDAPYITETGQPGTVTVGDTLLIPSEEPPQAQGPTTPVLGVSPFASADERLFGTDFKLTQDEDGFFDFQIDVQGGAIDFALASGRENLKQALLYRVSTEKGTNVLYQSVGHDPLVALDPSLDANVAVFRLAQAVEADPRVTRVQNVRIRESNPDAILVDFDVVPVDGSSNVAVTFEV